MKDQIRIDPKPMFDLPKYQFMQLLEPLGATDGSVAAAWNEREHKWRDDFIDVSKELGPTLMRWPGGCFSSYYRWKEGIGPANKRVPVHNILWGGMESNQAGTHEYMDYCRKIGADPLIAVNFESDGRPHWATFLGSNRSGSPQEAAEWVEYCNRPSHPLRRKNGSAKPFNVKMWQIGNETSYDKKGYDCETAAKRTLAFARAMKKADPEISLIGWGDSGWAPRMLEVAGSHLDYIAFHHHFRSALNPDEYPLQWDDYRKDHAKTWAHMMSAYALTERKIAEMREQVAGHDVKLAMTESHFSTKGRNRCDVLSAWAAGVAYARVLNVHERNGDILSIATLDDFLGVRWMSCALFVCQPSNKTYMLPVARVLSLYRAHRGKREATVLDSPAELDVTASRTGGKLFLHIANTSRAKDVPVSIAVEGMKTGPGKVFQIAEDPFFEVDPHNDERLAPAERALRSAKLVVPRASVSAVELEVRAP